jgi:hypothetical protein
VRALLEQGKNAAQIARELGLARSTVTYHKRRLGYDVEWRCGRRFDWVAIQRFYDLGHSVRRCQREFGFSRDAWDDAVRRGAIVPRPYPTPLEDLLVANAHRGRFNLKARLIAAGLKERRCERCGISEWRGKSLSLSLHHINGDRHDNRLENLALLCPNCHSQTPNFGSRNKAA